MARRKIIVNQHDHERLEDLFLSAFADAFRDKPYLRDLRSELDTARVVAPQDVPHDVVTMDSVVQLRDLESSVLETYTLVYPEEANIAAGKLSILAPLGTAILGYRVGDVVRWKVPTGTSRWRIEELVFQPERDCVAS